VLVCGSMMAVAAADADSEVTFSPSLHNSEDIQTSQVVFLLSFVVDSSL